MERWLRIRLGIILGLVFCIVVLYAPVVTIGDTGETLLQVRFLDVGQGDAIHIVTPDGIELLIDGGPSAVVLGEFAKGRSFFDQYIDVVIATHPDTDHVGGLVDMLERYEIGIIIESVVEHDAPAAVAYNIAAEKEGAEIIPAQAGQLLQLGASTTIEILSPAGLTENWQSNAASVVLLLRYGETVFMLTGDAPSNIEDYLVGTYGADLKANVLKLGHHGSNTSTSELFLTAVQPEYAVVSAGVDNRYGHPHREVVTRVNGIGARLLSTAELGTITFTSDGKTVSMKQ